MPHRHCSCQQIAAPRRNAAHSQATTPKREVLFRFTSHSDLAKRTLIPGESKDDFFRIGSELEARYQPRDILESLLVERMIVSQWRLIRIATFERIAPFASPDGLSEESKFCQDNVFQRSRRHYQRLLNQAIAQLKRLRKSNFHSANPTSN